MTAANPARIDAAQDMNALVLAVTGHRHTPDNRFWKLNYAAHLRHKTVEFRQHSGTLDATKAVNWLVTCLRMVQAAKGTLASVGVSTAPATNQARPGSKAHQIGEMLLRPQGVSGTEIRSQMNWPSVSIPQQARACGIAYTTVRTGREVRYYARVAQPTEAAAPITIEGFAQVIGASETERQYLAQRVTDLGGSVQWAA